MKSTTLIRHIASAWSWALLLLLGMAPSASAQGSGYHLVKKLAVGGDGFWDYLTLDGEAHRLYISRGTHVMVLDVNQGKIVGDLPDTPGVHGVAIAREFDRGFTSNGRDASVTIFDLKSLEVIGHAKTSAGPDAILYDPASRRVFTMNGRGNDATAIEAKTGAVAGTIPLGGRPEFAVADGAGHVYINLEDKSELVALDSRKLSVEHRWPLAPCESPSGMAMDIAHRRLFIGCHNEMMAIVDADRGNVVATVPIGRGVDANRFDPETKLAFSSNGDGTLTVVHEDSPGKFTVLDNVATQRGARTMELDPANHDVYLVTAEFGPRPEATPENPRPRPTMVPGSFVVLVFGR